MPQTGHKGRMQNDFALSLYRLRLKSQIDFFV